MDRRDFETVEYRLKRLYETVDIKANEEVQYDGTNKDFMIGIRNTLKFIISVIDESKE